VRIVESLELRVYRKGSPFQKDAPPDEKSGLECPAVECLMSLGQLHLFQGTAFP